MEFQAVEYPNEVECVAAQNAVLTYATNNGTKAENWGCVMGANGKRLVVIDERLEGFDFSPYTVETFNTDDLNYFPVIELI